MLTVGTDLTTATCIIERCTYNILHEIRRTMLNYYNHENQNILFTFILPQGRVHGSSSRGVTLYFYFRGFQS